MGLPLPIGSRAKHPSPVFPGPPPFDPPSSSFFLVFPAFGAVNLPNCHPDQEQGDYADQHFPHGRLSGAQTHGMVQPVE